ncbi:hypothetical protein BS17DRAFT_604827 [Gyrodon lividus]|nr:hypothetical protein BS17DRAFT_604827 [Gyrodon lividus]
MRYLLALLFFLFKFSTAIALESAIIDDIPTHAERRRASVVPGQAAPSQKYGARDLGLLGHRRVDDRRQGTPSRIFAPRQATPSPRFAHRHAAPSQGIAARRAAPSQRGVPPRQDHGHGHSREQQSDFTASAPRPSQTHHKRNLEEQEVVFMEAKDTRRDFCPTELFACPILSMEDVLHGTPVDWKEVNYECVDFLADLRSCGGCSSVNPEK